MRISWMLMTAVLVGGAPGCKKIAGMAGEAVGQSNDPAKSDAAKEAMGHYAKGFNALLSFPQNMLRRYRSAFPESGPEEGKKYNLISDYTAAASHTANAKKEFAEAAKVAPDSLKHIQPIATSVITDMEKVIELCQLLYNYYNRDDFKEDKSAKGKQLHADFVKASNSYRDNLDKLEKALSDIEDKQADEELKEFADKNTYSHQFRFYNRQANKLVNAKREAFLATYPAVEAAFTSLDSFTKANSAPNASFKAYALAAENFYGTAKKLKRAVESKAKEEELDELEEKLTDDYNSLVNNSNSLRSLESANLLK
ncbi:MAG TPA: DUF3829 domain-containing protein [Polyangiaceae bacterium]